MALIFDFSFAIEQENDGMSTHGQERPIPVVVDANNAQDHEVRGEWRDQPWYGPRHDSMFMELPDHFPLPNRQVVIESDIAAGKPIQYEGRVRAVSSTLSYRGEYPNINWTCSQCSFN